MKKATLILMMLLTMGLTSYAQSEALAFRYGYMSYDSVLVSMPEYAEMQTSMEQLRAQYAAEQRRVEEDFNRKYEDFLDGMAGYPKTILQKRQSELQEMLDKNIAFKQQSQRLLAEAEAAQKAQLKAIVQDVLATLGAERGYAFILNTDKEALPFVNPLMGEDITDVVRQRLATRQ